MKKRNWELAALLALTAAVGTACGSSSSTEQTTAAATTAEETKEELTVLTGEADGYGGKIQAEVSVNAEGKIKALTLTGKDETESIGGKAIPELQEAILAAGGIDGVDAVSGATWTSNGVFDAIKNALGIEDEKEEGEVSEVSASGLKHGIAVVSTPRLGPGKDDKDVPVYSFNEVVAYVITDAEDKLVDLQVDIMEIITPNHDSADDNYIAGWPGQSYAADLDGDGTSETVLEETEDTWTEEVIRFRTKRARGNEYKMNSGTWEQEMDIFEDYFKGKTAEEIEESVATLFSDLNGRPLNGNSEREEDIKKREALTEEQLAEIDAMSGATMSVNDAHGDIVGAIVKAMNSAKAMKADTDIASIGLGVQVDPRLGPGKDDQDVPVYSMNVVVAGAAYDADEKIVDSIVDILEIITPNHDGANDNRFPGWPGQSYNADLDADEKVETVLEQTEDSFVESISAYRTKRELGDAYKMNSGTWEQEMDIYQEYFRGKTLGELGDKFYDLFSDLNGRPLNGNSDKEEDVAKREALTEEQLAEIDGLSGATMSISDAHGDILSDMVRAWENREASVIKVG